MGKMDREFDEESNKLKESFKNGIISKGLQEQLYSRFQLNYLAYSDNSLTWEQFLKPIKETFEIDKLLKIVCEYAIEFFNGYLGEARILYTAKEYAEFIVTDVFILLTDSIYTQILENADNTEKEITKRFTKAIKKTNRQFFQNRESKDKYIKDFVEDAFSQATYTDDKKAEENKRLKMGNKIADQNEELKIENFHIKNKDGIEWRDQVFYEAT